MHRYVIAVATGSADGFEHLTTRLRRQLVDWREVLTHDLVVVWSRARPPSQLTGLKIGDDSALLGRVWPVPPPSALNWPAIGKATLARGHWGPFVLVQADRDRRAVSVARDPSGRLECYRMALPGGEVLFSHFDAVRPLLDRPPTVDAGYVGFALLAPGVHGSRTGLSGVSELLPGFARDFRTGDASADFDWWRPQAIAADPHDSAAGAAAAIREAVIQSIERWASPYGAIALDLSGGLDSAVVLAGLRQCGAAPICVNHVTAAAEGDEFHYAAEAAAFNDLRIERHDVRLGLMASRVSFTNALVRPSTRVLSAPIEGPFVDHLRTLGVEAYFTGQGGDQLFGKGVGGEAICDFRRDRGLNLDLIRVAHGLARLSKTTIWGVLGHLPRRPSDPARQAGFLQNPFVLAEVQSDPNLLAMAHPWTRLDARVVGPAKLRQILEVLASNRIYARYGRAGAAEEVHPLVSQPVLEACLRTPCYWLSEAGVDRSLIREAFRDAIPQTIRKRRSKGATSSFWLEVIMRDLPLWRERMLDGELCRMGLIDRSRMDAALHPLALAREKAFAALMFCLSTEVWLQQGIV
jgi:asparagine synthase (glutamine-hydrolysing)